MAQTCEGSTGKKRKLRKALPIRYTLWHWKLIVMCAQIAKTLYPMVVLHERFAGLLFLKMAQIRYIFP